MARHEMKKEHEGKKTHAHHMKMAHHHMKEAVKAAKHEEKRKHAKKY